MYSLNIWVAMARENNLIDPRSFGVSRFHLEFWKLNPDSTEVDWPCFLMKYLPN